MYVKVLNHIRNRAARFYQTDPHQPLDSGRERMEVNPAVLTLDELSEGIRVSADHCDLSACQLEAGPSGYFDNDTDRPFWDVSWVMFHKPGDPTTHLVASVNRIYLIDDTSGATIDRVGG